jgi:GTP-binding protein Era
VDVIGFCVPANEKIGPGDRFIAQQLAASGSKPVVAIVTKTDTVSRAELTEQLLAVTELGRSVMAEERGVRAERAEKAARKPRHRSAAAQPAARPAAQDEGHATDEPGWADVIPVSAVDGFQVDALAGLLVSRMPVSPPLYPDGELTDEPELTMVAELVREAALEGVRDELPHSLAVVVEEMVPREGRPADRPLLDVRVNVFVERQSQKAIVIGKGGARLREIGTRSRTAIEALLGTKVYLDLHVKVAKEWQRDPKQLSRLGF